MDFGWSENQRSVRDLARGILEKEVPPERVREVERADVWFDDHLWRTLAEAGLTGLTAPEAHGGMGFGILEACVLLEEVGRVVAPVPVLPVLVGSLALARFGSPRQCERVLPEVVSGDTILALAWPDLPEGASGTKLEARLEDGGWLLRGRTGLVPFAGVAAYFLVPAEADGLTSLFLVAADSVTKRRPNRISTGEQRWELEFEGARAERLDRAEAAGRDPAAWLRDHLLVALCATQVGVVERALEITSRYVSERVQFGVPIGSFQAVQHRAADAYIDVAALRWVTWRAAWKLSRGEEASREAAVAKFWAAEAGTRVTDAAQHLHGGIGVDVDYPIHRYFLWSRAAAYTLGGAAPHLARLGRDLAERGVGEET